MDEAGNTKDDVKKPEGEIGDRIDKLFTEEGKDVNVTVMSAMGEEVAVEAKEGPKSG
jgi:translation initiation factor 5A